mmetsp:Transcript_59199/g.152299  ORF Transcript_59199/g.152299 Transcript_59199/m.152299 type:complete len:380 (-) Transcript_59199:30-1169(-)
MGQGALASCCKEQLVEAYQRELQAHPGCEETIELALSPKKDDVNRSSSASSVKRRWSRLRSAVASHKTDDLGVERQDSEGGGVKSMRAIILALSWIMEAHNHDEPVPEGWAVARPSGNRNMSAEYAWLRKSLETLARNEAGSLRCRNSDTCANCMPLFFVIGACPNSFCGMQAVMYSASNADNCVDFWWVKPSKERPQKIEKATLSRHSQGVHKNDPGRSKQFLQPLADLFMTGSSVEGWRFGIENVHCKSSGASAPRAWMQCTDVKKRPRAFEDARSISNLTSESSGADGMDEAPRSPPARRKLLVHLMWQEDWSSSPFASSKYVKGKIVYQKMAGAAQYFARQYEITDGVTVISEHEEKAWSTTLPPDNIKQLWVHS